MSEAVETLEGWYALHDFRTIDWNAWRALGTGARQSALHELLEQVKRWSSLPKAEGSFGLFQMVGHKADLLFLHLRPRAEQLLELETILQKMPVATALTRPYSYFSVVELSKYLARGADPVTNPALMKRLEPELPTMSHVSFYPMNKKRDGHDNWYMLSREERREMMKDHGIIGHKYHEKVIQMITGSQGLDDWEWGVTLFADDPVLFKKLIYEMRFDEASARFAEFGPFYVGRRINPEDLATLLSL